MKPTLINIHAEYETPETCKRAWLLGLPQRTGPFFWFRDKTGEGEFKLVPADFKPLKVKPRVGEFYRAIPKYASKEPAKVGFRVTLWYGFAEATVYACLGFADLFLFWYMFQGRG